MKFVTQTIFAIALIAGVFAGTQAQRAYQEHAEFQKFSAEGTSMSVVYRCGKTQVDRRYLSHPQDECAEIYVVSPLQAETRTQSFAVGEYTECAASCAERNAGYQWADRYRIDDPMDCSGRSQSFVIGCQVYAKVLSARTHPVETSYAMVENTRKTFARN